MNVVVPLWLWIQITNTLHRGWQSMYYQGQKAPYTDQPSLLAGEIAKIESEIRHLEETQWHTPVRWQEKESSE